MEPIIRVEHLTHTYSAGTPFQRSAVEDVSIDVMPGEFLGIIGHTGSGKSTLIQHLNGLLRPTQGRVLLDGKDIWAEPKKIRQVRFQVGLVFQYPEYQLFEETVYKDIAFGPGNMGLSKEEIDRRVRESAALVGLTEDQLDKSPFDLSGGQKRRVAIAGVMFSVCESMLFAQEAGLDVKQWLELVVPGGAGSVAMGTLGRRLLGCDYAPGFFVDHFVKDLGLCLEECKRMGLVLPGLALSEQIYRMAQAKGHGKDGTQVLLQVLAELSGKQWRTHA